VHALSTAAISLVAHTQCTPSPLQSSHWWLTHSARPLHCSHLTGGSHTVHALSTATISLVAHTQCARPLHSFSLAACGRFSLAACAACPLLSLAGGACAPSVRLPDMAGAEQGDGRVGLVEWRARWPERPLPVELRRRVWAPVQLRAVTSSLALRLTCAVLTAGLTVS